ncbi:beta strand repeat-containing protein [Flavobacterium sp. ZS1P14]|uniref:beta strand repeat-containing protein n=1 Tax=Flavobacterium sp. ZS1P14 TaxID=3401729 RepID=UPI003AAE2FB9
MKTLFAIFKIVFFLLFFGTSTVAAQDYFQVIGGIPYLPAVDPSSVSTPVSGMLIYSTTENQPFIYNGSSWETLCSSNIDTAPVNDYLEIKTGIPFLPSLSAVPAGIIRSGAVYLSKTGKAMMLHDKDNWGSVAAIAGKGNFVEYSDFSTDSGLKVSKLPVLKSDPIPLRMGGIYINTVSKAIRYYNGALWVDITCLPVISLIPPTSISSISALSGVNIINNGGSRVTLQGICWSTNVNPDISLATKTSNPVFGTDTGLFPSTIASLKADTVYHVRAYAVNSSGIVYSDDVTFRTAMADLASLITIPIDASLSLISANSGGIINSDGGGAIYLRGITWSIIGDPISHPATKSLDGSGVGPFPSQITSLVRNTNYYVRAYADNEAGRAYGNLLELVTAPATTPVLSLPNIKIKDITDTSAVSEVTIIDNGGEVVTERGMCWSTDRVNIIYGPSTTVGPIDIGVFVCNITGLVTGTTYFVRGYAKNSIGISYTSESSFITTSLPTLTTIIPYNYDVATYRDGFFPSMDGTRAASGGDITSTGISLITKRGICWSTSPNPTVALVTKIEENISGKGTGLFYKSFAGLTPATTYYVRAYAINSNGIAYGNGVSFKTPQQPVLTTTSASLITNTTASSGGNIATDGGLSVTERGLCWSLTGTPSISGAHVGNGTGDGNFIINLKDLKGGTTYYIRAYAINTVGVSYGSILNFTTASPEKATITTTEVLDTSDATAIAGGNITGDGGADISSRGIIWSFTPDFVPDLLSPNKIENSDGSATFNCTIVGLVSKRTYYVVAYAVNSAGVAYGNIIHFKTYTLPSLTTKAVAISSISATAAVSGGDIYSDGGDTVTSSGIVWSTSINPTAALATKTTGGIGIGEFINDINGLMGSTTYYVRAYAINRAGTAYGNEINFTTKAPTLPDIETVDPTKITGNTALGGGRVISDGGGVITEFGIVWSTVSGFTPSTTTSQKTVQTILPASGSFTSDINDLVPGTTYYICAYASNLAGTRFGPVVVFKTALLAVLTTIAPGSPSITSTSATSGGKIIANGGSFISRKGICWSITNNPTIADSISEGGSGSSDFMADLKDLMGSTTYYVRSFAVNAAGIAYGNQISFITRPPVLVTIVTTAASEITGETATSGGDITSNGGAIVSSRGIVWSIDPLFDPDAVVINRTGETGYEKGIFVSYMKTLTKGTTYYVRAYAVSVAGTSYGNTVSFTTPTMATITTNLPGFLTATTAVTGGTITNSGGSAVLKRGVFWTIVKDFVPDALSADQTNDGTGIGKFDSVLKDLTANTTYYVRAYAITITGISYGGQVSFTTSLPTKARLTTVSTTEITSTTVKSGGEITDEGGATTNIRGVVWSTLPNFDPVAETVNRTVQIGAGKGVFSSAITGLIRGATYYVRAYASNEAGTTYGNGRSFTTSVTDPIPVMATIITNTADLVTSSKAVLGGTIMDSGGSTVLNKGVFWSTVKGFIPDIASTDKTEDGTGTSNFYSYLKKLTSNTTYYVKAYAVTTAGISYGGQVSFKTSPTTLATLTTIPAIDITGSTANSGGDITDEGGETTHIRGVLWSTLPDFDPATVLANKTRESGAGTGTFASTLINLNPGITYYVCAYAVNTAGISYGDKISFTTPSLAIITTNSPGIVTNTTAVIGGTISSSGGSAILKRGIFWSTAGGFIPDILSPDQTDEGTGIGSFDSMLKDLTPDTRYYVKAYAITAAGISYGQLVSFFTYPPTRAVLTTVVPTNITDTTADSGGNIADEGGVAVDSRGVLWSTVPDFDPVTVTVNKTVQIGGGTGVFTSAITGLNRGTTYYVRSYATNIKGTAYGDELSFTTQSTPTLFTYSITENTGTAAVSGGLVLSDGGAPVIKQGVCWSTGHNPTVGFATRTVDSGAEFFTSNLSDLVPGTMYYVRAYATNKIGTSYGNEVFFVTNPIRASLTTVDPEVTSSTTANSGGLISSTGGAPITARGIVWSSDENFDPDTIIVNRTTDGSGVGGFISELKDLVKSITYYVRAYATNSAGTAYGNQLTVVIFATSPILDTNKASSITATTAIGGGLITSDGGAVVTQRGICWSTKQNPTITLITKTSDADLGDGSFTSLMTGLLPNTLYYVRAYAKNGIGVAYGFEESFITLAAPTLTATTSATGIRATMATSGGWITDDGRTPILSRGIVWDTYSNPTVALSTKTVDKGTLGTGIFSSDLTGLLPNTTYYVRAYATNIVGITYGSEMVFKTGAVTLPVLSATTVTDIAEYSANGHADVLDDGGMPITTRGFVWSTSTLPTIGLSTKIVNGTTATGPFNDFFSGLISGTFYYLRAYATNIMGTAYGDEVVFKTLALTPSLSNVTLSTIQLTSAIGTASLDSDGGAAITDLGLIWNTTATIPVATPSNSLSVGAVGTAISATLTGLLPGTVYYIWAFGTNEVGTGYSVSPKTFTTLDLATLTTTNPNTITSTSAIGGGTITNSGGVGVSVLDRGVCWDTAPNPTVGLPTKTSDGLGSGTFGSTLSGLTKGTLYYVRAYAITAMGTSYGNQQSFSTVDTPSVTTTAVAASVTAGTASCSGSVASDGGASVTSRGVCWSTTHIPTILGSKISNGIGTGSFTVSLSSLTAATTYYFRAYATNAAGTAYGSESSFTTLAVAPTLGNVSISSILMNTAVGNATLTADGGATMTDLGLIWNTTSAYPVRTGSNSFSVAASGTSISGTLTGLLSGTAYYVWAFGTNAIGTTHSAAYTTFTTNKLPVVSTTAVVSAITDVSATSGGTITNTGGAGVSILASGICWSTVTDPTIGLPTKTSDGPLVTGTFASNLSGLTKGTLYYVRAYATNSMGTSYGANVTFSTPATASVTTATSVTPITSAAATCVGSNVTSIGGSAVTSRGVCYGTTTGPTILGTKTTNSSGLGVYNSAISALASGTTYYYRAYATNSSGTAYGDELTFTTLAVLPIVGNVTISNQTTVSVDGSATITAAGGPYLPTVWCGVRWVRQPWHLTCWTVGRVPELSQLRLAVRQRV